MITGFELTLSLLILLHIAFFIHAIIIAVQWISDKSERYGTLIGAIFMDNFLILPVLIIWVVAGILFMGLLLSKFLFH